MPRLSKSAIRMNEMRGQVLVFGCILMTAIFLFSVVNNVAAQVASHVVNAPNGLAGGVALLAAGLSYWWEGRIRVSVAFCLGLLLASYLVWQLGLHIA